VSCFGTKHLGDILGMSLAVPAVNQIDLHPFMTRPEIVKFCKEHKPKIALEAWAPLVRGEKMGDPSVVALARKYNKEPAQVFLRYSLQKDYVAIPKSVHEARIISNTNIFDFELEESEVKALDELNSNYVTDWDPTNVP